MLDWNSASYNQERHKDFVREAEHDRLVAEAVAAQESACEDARAPRVRLLDRLHCRFITWRRSFRFATSDGRS